MREKATNLKNLLDKIGCDASDFSDNELNILKTLVNKDIEIKNQGTNYWYRLVDSKIIETSKPANCDGCYWMVKGEECNAQCLTHREYDIPSGVNMISKRHEIVPFRIYYVSPDYTIMCGTRRIYANNIKYMGFLRMKDYIEPSVVDGGLLPRGKYRVTANVSVKHNHNMPTMTFMVNGIEYSALTRFGRWRTRSSEFRATVYFEVLNADTCDIFVPLVIEHEED